jgi:alkylation response protein AidB-like acyl-CoA dehydrogenase
MTASEFAEFHDDLRAVAHDVLGRTGLTMASGWNSLAETGLLGLEVPEALGGGGATFAEVAIVLQEMGRAATISAYLGGVVLGVGTLALLTPDDGRDEMLRSIASGDLVVATALANGDVDTASVEAPFQIAQTGTTLRLRGRASFVPDAPDADRLLLLALDADDRPVVVEIAPDTVGLEVESQPVLDATRRFGLVTADDIDLGLAVVRTFEGDAIASARRLLDRAAAAIAIDSLGLSEAMLDATVSYAGVREQFGRPIGSFQAVKHACADMLVHITVARELVGSAVRFMDEDDPDASTAASMAKSYACATAVDIVGKAMQLHGGIGYTWESGVHVYLKRAALDRSLFGSPGAHRRSLARRYSSNG